MYYTKNSLQNSPTTDEIVISGNEPQTIFVENIGDSDDVKQTYSADNGIMFTRTYSSYYNTWTTWARVAFILEGTSVPDNSLGRNGNLYVYRNTSSGTYQLYYKSNLSWHKIG